MLLVIVGIMLVAGLNPRDYRFRNEARWSTNGIGLVFGHYARVHTPPFLDASSAQQLNAGGFTLEIVAEPHRDRLKSFGILASFHAGGDASQFIVGQWRNSIIVMNGDDYSYRRRTPRIFANLPDDLHGRVLITVTSGTNGSRLYFNGKQAVGRKEIHLHLPTEATPARLTLGNSARASEAWPGEMGGLALIPSVLSAEQVRQHHESWTASGSLRFATNSNPRILYACDEGHGSIAENLGSAGPALEFPSNLHALEARFLASLPKPREMNRALYLDAIVNLLGFIPFGLVGALVVLQHQPGRFPALLLVTATGAGFSLAIELAQVWMPSRDSSLLDLILNSLGSLVGAIAGILLHPRIAARPAPADSGGQTRR